MCGVCNVWVCKQASNNNSNNNNNNNNNIPQLEKNQRRSLPKKAIL
jgi:hypothetical protein